MNIMLISVNQRIKEVGLRKAVGAKKKDVLLQFLVESATVSLIGGIIGIISGVLVSFVAAIIVQQLGYDWPFLVSLNSIVVALAVSLVVGIVFGVYPAKKASEISPMEALRYE
jgi:ABC-type antimicrobial peptide transport system permease subunit